MVVVDTASGEIDSYGPMVAAQAERMVGDLRALLDTSGVVEVAIAVARMHVPDGPEHPEDP